MDEFTIKKKSSGLFFIQRDDMIIEFKCTNPIMKDSVIGTVLIDGEAYGRIKISDNKAINKLFKRYSNVNPFWNEIFSSSYDFANMFLSIADKIIHKDYTRDAQEKESEMEKEISLEVSEFLSNKKILDTIDDIVRNSREDRLIGEESNALLILLSMVSSKTRYPVSIEFVGESSSGKTFLVLTVSNAFPDANKVIVAGASAATLKYDVTRIDDDGVSIIDLDEKIMIVLEKAESENFVKSLKPILSHDRSELDYKVVEKSETARIVKTYRICGFPAFITMSIQNPDDVEQLTRELLASTDTTHEKIENIVSSIIRRATMLPTESEIDERLSLLQASMGSLSKIHVYNPFFKIIEKVIPKDDVKMFRDLTKFMALIESMTILHQKNRFKVNVGGKDVLISSLEDNIITFSCIDNVFRSTFLGIPEQAFEVYKYIEEMATMKKRNLNENTILEFMRAKDVRMTKKTLDRHLMALDDIGMITCTVKSYRNGVKVQMNDNRKKLDSILSITPYIVGNFIRDMESVFDHKTIELLSSMDMNDIEYNKDLEKHIRNTYPKLSNIAPQVATLLEINYCNDSSSFVQEILHDDVKRVFRKPMWWRNTSTAILDEYDRMDRIKALTKGKIIGDLVEIEELELEEVNQGISKKKNRRQK